MQMIRENQFDGRIRSDPHRHVASFLEISNILQYGENQEEAVMLRTFPFSLSGEAKTWLNELNERTITTHGLTRGTIIQIFYHGLDDPTQGILDAGGIFLYKTPSEAFKILEDKKLKALATKIDSEFLILRKELKEIYESVYKPPSIRNENDKGDVAAIEEDAIKPIPTMSNPSLIKYNSPFLKNSTMHILYTNAKTFVDDVLLNNVGDKELKSIDDVGNGVLTKKEIMKDDKGMPKEPNKEWKLNEKVVPYNENVYHYQWHPTEIPHLNPGTDGGVCLEVELINLARLC
ncbi:hypothetical protein Tco_1359068 [Tanacetum coccineum]